MNSVFISYSREDSDISIIIEERFKESGFIVYRDKKLLNTGDEWKKEIFSFIQVSDFFLLLWSESSAASTIVFKELLFAIEQNKRILPCILDETPITPILMDIHFFKVSTTISDEFESLIESFNIENSSKEVEFPKFNQQIISTYKSIIKNEFRYFNVLFENQKKEVEKAYVQLNLTTGFNNSKANRGILSSDLLELAKNQGAMCVVAGHPGSGKTSLQNYLMYLWANSNSNHMVLLCSLKDYDSTLYGDLSVFLLSKTYFLKKQSITFLEGLQLFDNHKCIILLDGLDEVPNGSYNEFVKQLNNFINKFRSISIILTTRIDGFRGKKEKDFVKWKIYSISNLDDFQIESFVKNWFQNKEEYKVMSLLQKLKEPRIRDLASRTFLLALICLVFEENSKLGNNRSELYEQATDYLEGSRFMNSHYTIKQARRSILKDIALTYLQLNSQEINSEVLMAIVNSSSSNELGISPRYFLDSLVEDTGIMQKKGDTYIFTHKSFQEYYSALALKDLVKGKELLLDYCQVSEWEEPIRLYASSMSSSIEQEQFVASLWTRNPALALRTYKECSEISSNFIGDLIKNTPQSNRLRMLNQIQISLRTIDKKEAKRIVIETLNPLFSLETDSSVLYLGIELLNEFDPEDEGQIMYYTFYKEAEKNLNRLLSDPKYRFSFVSINEGSFLMGSDISKDKIERPRHTVILDAFEICKFQLTNLAYELIYGIEYSKRIPWVSDGNNQPVININWYDAYIFGLKINCRLPTEAEWEYATRAGNTGNWCFGDNKMSLKEYANYEDLGLNKTWDVGSGMPNEWGLYDVHGNVWEWCQDWLDFYREKIQKNPKGPEKGTKKVRRGGGHAYHARGCQSSFRWGNDPSYSFKDIGVRFVRNK